LHDDKQLLRTLRKMLSSDRERQKALALIARHHLATLGDEVLAICQRTEIDSTARVKAIDTAISLQLASAGAVLAQVIDSGAETRVSEAAARGLVLLKAWPLVEPLFAATGDARGSLRTVVVDALLETTDGALVLLRLVKNDRLAGKQRAEAIAKAVTHPDSNVRVLFETFLPEDQRPVRLGSAIEPDVILSLKGDRDRGREIFFRSTAAQCNNCHAIDGVGGTVGPDLSQIGRKYEPAVMLETILQPSKAIAPEYVAHLLETDAGQVYVGFVIERSKDALVLKDARGNLIRTAAKDVVALEPQSKSLMPELVLRDVTAQDAADLLAYLASLRNSVQHAGRLRVVGPFADKSRGIPNAVFGPDESPDQIDLDASYTDQKRTRRWQVVDTKRRQVWEEVAFNLIDLDVFCRAQRELQNGAVIYVAGFADSAAEQDANLLIANDESYDIWINGKVRHQQVEFRSAHLYDRIPVHLRKGRNVVLIKTSHNKGRNRGIGVAIESNANVQWRTE